MRAIVYERYGSPSVLELREVPTPVPASNEVLIRVHATTVSSADWRARSLAMPPGFDFEQIIDAHKYVDQGHKRGSVAITVAS